VGDSQHSLQPLANFDKTPITPLGTESKTQVGDVSAEIFESLQPFRSIEKTIVSGLKELDSVQHCISEEMNSGAGFLRGAEQLIVCGITE
jgi:hypothetical protein